MAQTGYTPIQIYSTSTAAAVPVAGNLTNSTLGSELAINITDGKLFYKDNANAIQVIGWKTVPTTAGGTGLTSFVTNQVFYASSTSAIGQSANLTFNGTTLTAAGLTTTGALQVDGNTTLGNASNNTATVNGTIGVGGANSFPAQYGAHIKNSALTGTNIYGAISEVTGPATATASINAFTSLPTTSANAFTVGIVRGFQAINAAKGAGSTITDLHGVWVADQTQGTNNYGVTSLVSSGANKWNIYAGGTANNYFAGKALIGTTTAPNGAAIRLLVADTGAAYQTFWRNSVTVGGTYLGTDGSNFIFGTATGTLGSETYTERMRIDSNGFVGIGVTPAARLHLGGAITAASWTTNGIGLRYAAATYTDSSTAASGTVASSGIHALARPTIAATNATVTYTNAATLYVANSPANGSNVTVTNPWSIWVDDGNVRFDGNEVAGGLLATSAAAPTIASAATIAPTTRIAFVSGTTAIATITAPAPISSGGGQITLIPTGLWTTNTTGNIALASTAVVSRALIMTYDTTTAKWYPSY